VRPALAPGRSLESVGRPPYYILAAMISHVDGSDRLLTVINQARATKRCSPINRFVIGVRVGFDWSSSFMSGRLKMARRALVPRQPR
jgi:hypothetical protein